MNKKFLIVWALLMVGIAGASLRYLFGSGTAPEGQPALSTASGFREVFARNIDKTRVVAYFDPADRKDLLCAALLDAQLAVFERSPLAIYIVWAGTPASDVLSRVPSKQAAQFADSAGTLRQSLGNGHVTVYARGASLDAPAMRSKDIEADMRPFLALLHENAPVPKVVTNAGRQ
ncbi:MAG: hypothetical protein FJW30_10555 [Acidobacteria bacterium]|nr:hypothetical protein [Acidobacteriota bacterium]